LCKDVGEKNSDEKGKENQRKWDELSSKSFQSLEKFLQRFHT